MYRWVLPCIAIILIVILTYAIYCFTRPSEGFLTSVPPQTYGVPEIRGVTARYVRILPSMTGDGYLTISQIQVIDLNGRNIALKKNVTATSTGGSPIDQKYAKVAENGLFEYGASADVSCIVDGTLAPRASLVNIFETGTPNTSADNQYVEIDLLDNVIVTSIIYTGQAYPQRGPIRNRDGTFDNVDQVTRLTNMRIQLFDTNRIQTYSTNFSDNPSTHITNIPITIPFNVGQGAASLQRTTVPNLTSYTEFVSPFLTYSRTNMIDTNIGLIRKVNEINSTTGNSYNFDISGGLFSILASESPINFYNEIYASVCSSNPAQSICKANDNCINVAENGCGILRPANIRASVPWSPKYTTGKGTSLPILSPTMNVEIFGIASTDAIKEMQDSIAYCQRIFLGNPATIENYIAVTYRTQIPSTFTPYSAYLRNSPNAKYCMPDIIQVFEGGGFVIKQSNQNRTWNTTHCQTPVTPEMLQLFPYTTRNFIVQWIQERSVRYILYANDLPNQAQLSPEVRMISIPPVLDISSLALLDSIAQQFYEIMGGQLNMTYIYDVCTIGRTIIDIRFDLLIHSNADSSYEPIRALKEQYNKFKQSGSNTYNQDILDQAKLDYSIKIETIGLDDSSNVSAPFKGAVVRLFYVPSDSTTGGITITGLIFDSRAVTSFNTKLNGGIPVPLGAETGNVNYEPKIIYTLNQPKQTLDCNNPETLRSIMDDYITMVRLNPTILKTATPPIDVTKGTLLVNKIIGATKVSPTQCAIQWNEILYDSTTNLPVTNGSQATLEQQVCGFNNVTRYGLLSYYIDTKNWYSSELIFDPSGFKLYPTNVIPPCIFDPATYAKSTGNRFNSKDTSPSNITRIKDDFYKTSFVTTKNTSFVAGSAGGSAGLQLIQTNSTQGKQICPQTLPGYIFNSADYLDANSLAANADVLTHYRTTGLPGNLPVKSQITILPLTSSNGSSNPIVYKKPIPAQYTLNSSSGICPVAYCDDLDILYKLVEQYNANPSFAGTILRVNRAFTAGPNQCDVDVDINYDSMIPDIIGQTIVDATTGLQSNTYPLIKKGTVTYSVVDGKSQKESKPMNMAGIQSVTIALYLAVDISTCSYMIGDAGGANSGTSIQANTPYLYKPMNYTAKLAEGGSSIGSSIGQVQTDITKTSGEAKNILTKYRANTYTAVGSIGTLTNCGGKSCSDPSIMNQIMNYYGPTMIEIRSTGSPNGASCDVTFITSSNQTAGMNFEFNSSCGIISQKSINPRPTYTDVKNLAVPLSTANISGFSDYSSTELRFTNPNLSSTEAVRPLTKVVMPLDQRGFGLDRARNSTDSLTAMQFTTPLEQIPPTAVAQEDVPSYKFIRFSSTKTREPSSFSVAIGKITFFYEGERLDLQGLAKVTNPMGTWEGALEDVTGNGLRSGWTDAHKKPLVFSFKDSIRIDEYSITTATGPLGSDPIAWKLEGSHNGTFWKVLDIQTRFPTPVERFKEIQPISFSV